MNQAITFDDVLLVPAYNHWESRRGRYINVRQNRKAISGFAVDERKYGYHHRRRHG